MAWEKIVIDDPEIIIVYRYEGESDSAEEVSVYALETNTGKKGILITRNIAHPGSRQSQNMTFIRGYSKERLVL